ncbi:MAG: hypothetical protein JNK75_12610 [Betaproteobacteria bacterium]|nr:hypothetical protein [Betaproteobacteria bacterium]
MNTRTAQLNKDNTLITTLLAATLLSVASGVLANHAPAATKTEVVRMEPIVVTAKRGADVKLETIVVTAPRLTRLA